MKFRLVDPQNGFVSERDADDGSELPAEIDYEGKTYRRQDEQHVLLEGGHAKIDAGAKPPYNFGMHVFVEVQP